MLKYATELSLGDQFDLAGLVVTIETLEKKNGGYLATTKPYVTMQVTDSGGKKIDIQADADQTFLIKEK